MQKIISKNVLNLLQHKIMKIINICLRTIQNVGLIYLVGDFNRDITILDFNFSSVKVRKYEVYTTPGAYSMKDNSGTRNDANVDCILKLEF